MMIHRDPDKERRRHDVASLRVGEAGFWRRWRHQANKFFAWLIRGDTIQDFDVGTFLKTFALFRTFICRRRRTLIVVDRRKNKQGGRVLTMDLRVTGLNPPRSPAAFVGHKKKYCRWFKFWVLVCDVRSLQSHSFCSTSVPLASPRCVQLTLSSLCPTF